MHLRSVVVACALFSVCGAGGAGARFAFAEDTDPHAAFFEAFERGDGKAALAKLPAEVRDASPYDARSEALAPYRRDEPIYAAILERLDQDAPVTDAARREATLHAAVAAIAWREKEFETARRRLLLALRRDPFDRLAHLTMTRCYAALEVEALKGAGDRPPGEVLIEKVGFGSGDLHVQLAEEIVEKRFGPDLEAVTATFRFDAGTVSELVTTRAKASATARLQRPKAAAPDARDFQVVLVGVDRRRLDEAWFAPVQTIYRDGMDGSGLPTHSKTEQTTFQVSVELLAPSPPSRVLVYDAAGKRVHEAPVSPVSPAK